MYKKSYYDIKQTFVNYKDFFENEFNILPTNNSYPVQSNQDTIVEEIEGDPEVSGFEFDLDISCDKSDHIRHSKSCLSIIGLGFKMWEFAVIIMNSRKHQPFA